MIGVSPEKLCKVFNLIGEEDTIKKVYNLIWEHDYSYIYEITQDKKLHICDEGSMCGGYTFLDLPLSHIFKMALSLSPNDKDIKRLIDHLYN